MSRTTASRFLLRSLESIITPKGEFGDAVCTLGLAKKMSTATLPNVKDGKVMHPDLLNDQVKAAEYAVRGELYLRGEELRKEGKEIIFTNGMLPVSSMTVRLSCSRQPPGTGRKTLDVLASSVVAGDCAVSIGTPESR